MSSLAPLDLSDLDLPFQLPASSQSAPGRAAEGRSPGSQPVTSRDRPAPRPPGRPLGPARSFEGVYVPHAESCTCGCQSSVRQKPLLPPTVAKTPAMARRKRPSPADPPPLIAPAPPKRTDSSASGGVPEAPPLKALPWLHHDSPEPAAGPSASYGTRSSRSGRTSTATQATPIATGSLKIVLKAPKRNVAPPPSLPTPSSSTGSPSVVVPDSSVAPSEASSRSESPAITHSAIPANVAEGSALGMPAHVLQPTHAALSTPPGSVDGTPARATSAEGGSGRKGKKNGRDGLNRVCHHHKSQTERARMTCTNAPTCKTVWCKGCVEKYYLAFTPHAQFESSTAFACPVCQEGCLCASCKRKRRSSNKDVRRPQRDNELVIALSIPPVPTSDATKEDKAAKRERRKKARESAGVALDAWTPSAAGWGPSPVPTQEGGSDSSDEDARVSRMLIGEAAAAAERQVQSVGGAAAEAPANPAQQSTLDAADATLVVKRRNSLTSAYDRENPIHFPTAPPTVPQAVRAMAAPTTPAITARQAAAARRRSAAAAARARAAAQPSPAAPAHDYAHYHTVSIFASGPTPDLVPDVPVATASGRPKRNKRPSTAFDDYAVDFATSAAAGLVDRSASPGLASFATPSGSASSRRRNGSSASRDNNNFGRISLDMFAPKRKVPRRWRSDLSSASDCDGSAYSSMDEDSETDLADAEAAASKGVAEQPLPVLAGLERNLGIEPAGDGDGDNEALTFGEAFTGVVPPLLDIDGSEGARRKVKWIEGPERRKRRAMAAAAAAGPASDGPGQTGCPIIKVEPDADTAGPQTTRSVSPSEPEQLFSPPALKRSTSLPLNQGPSGPSDHPSATQAAEADEMATSSASTPETRSAKDVKLAFALLDAVRAAVGGVIGSPVRAEGNTGGIGAALQAALTTGTTALSPPTKLESMETDTETSPSTNKVPIDVEIDYKAHELEAMRRLEALAAQEKVDPGKAFKATARDGAEAQLFVGSPLCDDDEDDDQEAVRQPVIKSEETEIGQFGFEVTFRVADADAPDFDTDSPIDDLWTPASAADSMSTAPSTSASNAFGEDPLCVRHTSATPRAPSAPASPALADEYPLFAAAVGSGLTPPQNGSVVAIPRTPTRGLLGSAALHGLEELDVVGASGLAMPLHVDELWMDERDAEVEAY